MSKVERKHWKECSLPVVTGRLRGDRFLALHFPALNLPHIRHAIRDGCVSVNGRVTAKADWVLRAGDNVNIKLPPDEAALLSATTLPEVLWADADLLIVNKPAGILSHPSPQKRTGTLLDAASQYVLQHGGAERPALLHRLDCDTSGAVAFALNGRAAQVLNRAFQERRVHKFYLALVNGVVAADAGEINAPIGPTPKLWPHWRIMETGAEALTKFTVAQRFAQQTLLSLEPLTGRTHQLRIHCLHLGHPVVGDKVYRLAAGLRARRQMLHAHRLILPHPSRNSEIEAIAPYPADFAEALAGTTGCQPVGVG